MFINILTTLITGGFAAFLSVKNGFSPYVYIFADSYPYTTILLILLALVPLGNIFLMIIVMLFAG